MDPDEFIVATHCLVDDLMGELLEGRRLRERGPDPALDDREVLTIEIVGEALGIDTDGALLVGSFAVPVTGFAKAPHHESFAGVASIGHDAMNRAAFYGFDAHPRVAWPGVIAEATLAPANVHDRWVAEHDLLVGVGGGSLVVGDGGHWSPLLKEKASPGTGVDLLAPKKTNKRRERHPLAGVADQHQETQDRDGGRGKLAERYRMKRVRARDLWHLTSRFFRKILSHTCCVLLLCQRAGLSSPLRFSELLAR